ncbi:Achaete-scute-like 4, partial [Fragariocoptes setiger]
KAHHGDAALTHSKIRQIFKKLSKLTTFELEQSLPAQSRYKLEYELNSETIIHDAIIYEPQFRRLALHGNYMTAPPFTIQLGMLSNIESSELNLPHQRLQREEEEVLVSTLVGLSRLTHICYHYNGDSDSDSDGSEDSTSIGAMRRYWEDVNERANMRQRANGETTSDIASQRMQRQSHQRSNHTIISNNSNDATRDSGTIVSSSLLLSIERQIDGDGGACNIAPTNRDISKIDDQFLYQQQSPRPLYRAAGAAYENDTASATVSRLIYEPLDDQNVGLLRMLVPSRQNHHHHQSSKFITGTSKQSERRGGEREEEENKAPMSVQSMSLSLSLDSHFADVTTTCCEHQSNIRRSGNNNNDIPSGRSSVLSIASSATSSVITGTTTAITTSITTAPTAAEHANSNKQQANKKSSYKHIPHSQKPAHLVAKRNARERRRVQAVNQAFVRLRKSVPIENRNKRVSKVKTLLRAIEYIRSLERVLEGNNDNPSADDHLAYTISLATSDNNNSSGVGGGGATLPLAPSVGVLVNGAARTTTTSTTATRAKRNARANNNNSKKVPPSYLSSSQTPLSLEQSVLQQPSNNKRRIVNKRSQLPASNDQSFKPQQQQVHSLSTTTNEHSNRNNAHLLAKNANNGDDNQQQQQHQQQVQYAADHAGGSVSCYRTTTYDHAFVDNVMVGNVSDQCCQYGADYYNANDASSSNSTIVPLPVVGSLTVVAGRHHNQQQQQQQESHSQQVQQVRSHHIGPDQRASNAGVYNYNSNNNNQGHTKATIHQALQFNDYIDCSAKLDNDFRETSTHISGHPDTSANLQRQQQQTQQQQQQYSTTISPNESVIRSTVLLDAGATNNTVWDNTLSPNGLTVPPTRINHNSSSSSNSHHDSNHLTYAYLWPPRHRCE